MLGRHSHGNLTQGVWPEARGSHTLCWRARVCVCVRVHAHTHVSVCLSLCVLVHITSSFLPSMCPALAPLRSPKVRVAKRFFLTPLEGPGSGSERGTLGL